MRKRDLPTAAAVNYVAYRVMIERSTAGRTHQYCIRKVVESGGYGGEPQAGQRFACHYIDDLKTHICMHYSQSIPSWVDFFRGALIADRSRPGKYALIRDQRSAGDTKQCRCQRSLESLESLESPELGRGVRLFEST